MGFGERLGVAVGVVKSAVFIAKVEVIELAQVPLVHAKFRVKWSFKHPTTTSHVDAAEHALEDLRPGVHLPGSTRPSPSSPHYDGGRAMGGLGGSHRTHDSADESSASATSNSNSSVRVARELPARPLSPPMSPPLEVRTPNPGRTPTLGNPSYFTYPNAHPFGEQSRATSDSHASVTGTRTGMHNSRDSVGSTDHAHRRGATVNALDALPHPHSARAEPKGTTSLIPLRAHTAVFRREIQCPVAIPVKALPHSSRYQLQPSPLRLAVRQEVPLDGSKKEEAKTGEVILDLSQFVGHGRSSDATPRRYLLRDCKTNATLRVTVTLEWVGGERDFVAPPLKSGQMTSASTPMQSSTSLSNRSTTSLNSSKKTAASSPTNISRTNSSSSISMNSMSTRSTSVVSGGEKRPRGWHPTTSAFSSSPSPTLLGGPTTTNGADRSAFDIIDTIFNRPPQTRAWGGFHQSTSMTPEGVRTNGMAVGESDSLVFSTRSRNGVLPKAAATKPKPKPSPPSAPASLHPSISSTKSSTKNSPPHALSRTVSSASQISTRSRARSVRWDDSERPQPGPAVVSRKGVSHTNSYSSLDRLRENQEDGDVEDGADEPLQARKGVVGTRNAAVAVAMDRDERTAMGMPSKFEEERVREKAKVAPIPVAKAAAKVEKEAAAAKPIEWAKSWG